MNLILTGNMQCAPSQFIELGKDGIKGSLNQKPVQSMLHFHAVYLYRTSLSFEFSRSVA